MKLSFGPSCMLLLAGVFLYGTTLSFAQSGATPSSSTPGQAIPGTHGVSPFAGSVPAKLVPGVMSLSLQDAIDRGLKQNLGAAPLECRNWFGPRPALGAIERPSAARDGSALCRGLGDQS